MYSDALAEFLTLEEIMKFHVIIDTAKIIRAEAVLSNELKLSSKSVRVQTIELT